MLPLADDKAAQLLASIPEEDRDKCWWLVLRDGTPVPGDDGGGVALLAEVRLTRPLAHLVKAVRATRLLDASDELLARHRAALGRFVPEGDAPRRYP